MHYFNSLSLFNQYIGYICIHKNIYKNRTLPVTEGVKTITCRIVPALVLESVNPSMVPFILPVVLQVAERTTDEEYVDHILPHLKPIMKITEPVQVTSLSTHPALF